MTPGTIGLFGKWPLKKNKFSFSIISAPDPETLLQVERSEQVLQGVIVGANIVEEEEERRNMLLAEEKDHERKKKQAATDEEERQRKLKQKQSEQEDGSVINKIFNELKALSRRFAPKLFQDLQLCPKFATSHLPERLSWDLLWSLWSR